MSHYFSTKEVALALGVSQSSVKRWCDAGDLEMVQTSGGHRRISLVSLFQFFRRNQRLPDQPEILGLPYLSKHEEVDYGAEKCRFKESLISSDEEVARAVILSLYLSQTPISSIGDKLIAPVFSEIGNLWDCGDVQIYQERRCCEITLRILRELRSLLPPVAETAPLAIGATPPGDAYSLPVALVELVLRERGWNAISYGCQVPLTSLEKVVEEQHPRLIWISASYIPEHKKFLADYKSLASLALAEGTIMVVGGQGIGCSMRREMEFHMFGDTLRHFELFASICYQTDYPNANGVNVEYSSIAESLS
ncbi:MAG: helix-turn-helix domain-containing protein [Planctomycetaceae bacterium]